MRWSAYNIWVDRHPTRYVFNVLSGRFLSLSTERYERVQRWLDTGETDGLEEHVLRGLTEHRVLISEDVDELRVLKGRWNIGGHDPRRLGLTVVTSLGCNFDCGYCFEDKHPSLLSAEAQRGVLDLVRGSAGHLEHLDVTWFGGEPLLGKRSLLALSDELIEICDANGIDYSADIITNGWYLDEATARELKDRRVTSAQITIDGPADVHDRMRPHVNGGGTFERIIANLHQAVEHLDVRVRVSLDRHSAGRVEELFERFVAEGLAGRIAVYPGHLIGYDHNPAAPSASYGGCFSGPEFARAELEFADLARSMGLAHGVDTPTPVHRPCTAVRPTR